MAYNISLIQGDGIGKEISEAASRVIDATLVRINWDFCDAGSDAYEKYGNPLPDETITSIRKNKLALKGPITTPVGTGFSSVNVQLRKLFELYANYRPAHSITGINSRFSDVNLIVIRENMEGLYSGLEHEVTKGVVESIRVITEKGSERIIRFAFETAKKFNRKKVTAVHKANILKKSDGLFLEVAQKIAKEYPDVAYDESIIDATAMKLVIDPSQFDVLVMENLFGDIVSDLTSGLIGGLGVAPSANIGADCAIFEAVHGSAPD
ncbi:MAG: NAD-dependent isocitrate dehydrogenase, partial [Calditrichia bacterium]|nr:NAD-dependent isocitrate dehydrogenase [Calditrichia bacterium]